MDDTTNSKRYTSGERAPRYQQRPAVPPTNWLGGAALVAAIAFTAVVLDSAMDFMAPAASTTVVESSSALDALAATR